MLLKVECFEGFLNWSNIDELVINSMSGCNNLNNKNYKLTSNLAWKPCSLILSTLRTFSYLSTKFGIFPFKGDM